MGKIISIMKKILVATAMLLFFNNIVMAGNDTKPSNIKFALRGGITFAPTDWDETNINVYPTIGLSADFGISKLPFFIETGVYLTNRYIMTDNNISILAPALISYHIQMEKDMTIQPFIGPFIAYGFDYEEADVGVRMGVGLSINKLYTNCGYDISASNGFDEDAFFLSIGYNF